MHCIAGERFINLPNTSKVSIAAISSLAGAIGGYAMHAYAFAAPYLTSVTIPAWLPVVTPILAGSALALTSLRLFSYVCHKYFTTKTAPTPSTEAAPPPSTEAAPPPPTEAAPPPSTKTQNNEKNIIELKYCIQTINKLTKIPTLHCMCFTWLTFQVRVMEEGQETNTLTRLIISTACGVLKKLKTKEEQNIRSSVIQLLNKIPPETFIDDFTTQIRTIINKIEELQPEDQKTQIDSLEKLIDHTKLDEIQNATQLIKLFSDFSYKIPNKEPSNT